MKAGVGPSFVVASGFAPASSSAATMPAWPARAAYINAVWP